MRGKKRRLLARVTKRIARLARVETPQESVGLEASVRFLGPDEAPQGEVSHYDKRHLYRMGGEHDHVEPGDQRVVIELNGVRLLPLVCYDCPP